MQYILNEMLNPEKSNTGSNIGDAGSADNVIQEVSGLIVFIMPAQARMSILNF